MWAALMLPVSGVLIVGNGTKVGEGKQGLGDWAVLSLRAVTRNTCYN